MRGAADLEVEGLQGDAGPYARREFRQSARRRQEHLANRGVVMTRRKEGTAAGPDFEVREGEGGQGGERVVAQVQEPKRGAPETKAGIFSCASADTRPHPVRVSGF